MERLSRIFVTALLCATISAYIATAVLYDSEHVVWLTARPSSSRSSSHLSINALKTDIERALAESRFFAETGTMTTKKCNGITSLESTPIELVDESGSSDEVIRMRFRVGTMSASAIVRSLDSIRFRELCAIRGAVVEYGVEHPPSSGSGSGSGSGGDSIADDGLPIDDEDRIDNEATPTRIPSRQLNAKDFESILRGCLSRHVDRFMKDMSRAEQCIALHYLAVHTATTMDRVSGALKKKHRCSSISTETPSIGSDPATPPIATEPDRIAEITEPSNPDLEADANEDESSGGLQLALYVVIGLVSAALVVLAVNLVIFGLKRRSLRTVTVAGAESDPAANNAYSTKIQVDEKEGAMVRLDLEAGGANPRAGGVQNKWSDSDDESTLEEKA